LVRNVPLSDWRAAYSPPAERQPGELNALIIGSVFEGRGFEMILEALALARSAGGTGIRLEIIGPARPDYLASLKGLADRLDVGDSVDWVSRVESSEVSAAYLSAHVGLVLYESNDPGNDGLSNKILECVSSGRPVLAGNLPENRSFVSQHGVGWLSEMTAPALADTLRAIADVADLGPMSLHCRSVGDQELNWEREFEPVLRTALSNGAVGSDRM
jgi:glycosyltransferase involved in cell wall biosynthesis